MAVLLVLYHLLFEKEKMHRFNRFYLLGAVIFSLMLPFISIELPEYVEIPAPGPVAQSVIGTAIHKTGQITPPDPTPAKVPAASYLPLLAFGLYGLTTGTLAMRFGWNVVRFFRLRSKSTTVPYKGATLVLLEEVTLPYTFMDAIYLNREEYENRSIEPEMFTHELAHVYQRHTLDILFIEMIRTVMWFNPLLYLYKKAMRLNHEFLADESTINQHLNIPTYQKLLLGKSCQATVFALASSINFGTTKKRFIMMTKTTNKTKGMLLKLSVMPVLAILTYALATQTVIYAKTAPDSQPVVISEKSIDIISEVLADEKLPGQNEKPIGVLIDSASARRDEYYKGVRVIIDDNSRNLLIDKPYEMLDEAQKELYLAEAPPKKKKSEMSKADFDFYLSQEDALYYIDGKKTDAAAVKKHSPKDFATHRFSMSFADGVKLMQVFFYLPDYFEKHIRHSQDRYPDKVYKVTILAKALDYAESRNRAVNPPNNGMTDLDLARERLRKERSTESYSYQEFVKTDNQAQGPKFPGGSDKFQKYFEDNFTMKDRVGEKPLFITMSINTDGSVSEVTVRDAAPEIASEIKRVLENSPKWIPAQQNGQPLKMGYTINYPEKR